MLAEEEKSGRVRARQLSAVNELLPLILIANIVSAGGLSVLLHSVNETMLLVWFVLVTALSLGRLAISVAMRNQTEIRYAPQRALRSLTVQAICLGACFMSGPAYLLTQTSGLQFAIVVCQMTGLLWAGGLVLTTVPGAAVCYVLVAVASAIAGLLAGGLGPDHLYLAAMFVLGGASALRSIAAQGEIFVAGVRLQIDFQHQSDVIELLLKDYEDQTSDWLWETDAALCHRSPSARCVAALERSDITGARLPDLFRSPAIEGNGEACAALEAHLAAQRSFRDHVVPFATRDGEPRWLLISGRPHRNEEGTFIGFRGVASDVTVTKQAEERLAYLAHHDALTGLPNRSLLSQTLDHVLVGRPRDRVAVLSLDLDGFKAVNDRFGHPAGDALLVGAAERLRACVDAGDLVTRFGGDEFVVLDVAFASADDVEKLCKRINEELSKPFEIGGEGVTVGVSVGVAFAPVDGTTYDDLMKNADSALYRAKAEGRATYRFFAADMDRQLQERRRLVHDLRSALARAELVLHYQPYVSVDTGMVSGCEALLRWKHPERGLVAPAEFIPLAEQAGLIVAIGSWVIEQACRDAARWPDNRRVSVNVSALQLRTRDLPDTILAALLNAGLAPSRLELEVTEAVLIDDASVALDVLRQIRAMGVRIALDDFGTGYSSLSYLRMFPFDKIKIDRSFVQQLETQRDSQVIVRAIRDIAHGLDMTITAEGVETPEQAERLRITGCEELQGFLYSRPQPVERIGWENRLVSGERAA